MNLPFDAFRRAVLLFRRAFYRRDGNLYDEYWATHRHNWVYGINIIDKCIDLFSFHTALDAGCGTGDVVRYMLEKGYDARGCDVSLVGARRDNPALVANGRLVETSLTTLPYADESFDVVFSSEVLEHIAESEIDAVISELARVTKKVAFLTISLRPSSDNNRYHITLKPRSWWERHFVQHGFVKQTEIVDRLQTFVPDLTNAQVLERGPTQAIMHELGWFIEQEPYSLNGELEPWFFVFTKSSHSDALPTSI